MQRILMISCLSLITGLLSGCGIFYPPRHEVLVVEQTVQTEQAGKNTSEEIPLVSNPDTDPNANTFTNTRTIRTYTPRTYVMLGYPAFYAGWYPFWGYPRPFFSLGYHHRPFRRHHFHRPPPPPHGGHRPPRR